MSDRGEDSNPKEIANSSERRGVRAKVQKQQARALNGHDLCRMLADSWFSRLCFFFTSFHFTRTVQEVHEKCILSKIYMGISHFLHRILKCLFLLSFTHVFLFWQILLSCSLLYFVQLKLAKILFLTRMVEHKLTSIFRYLSTFYFNVLLVHLLFSQIL